MKPNEIIKGLECCLEEANCEECPYDEYCSQFKNNVLEDALHLINRQQAEIQQKDTEISILIRKKDTLRDEIEELQGVIENIYKQLKELEFLVELTGGD